MRSRKYLAPGVGSLFYALYEGAGIDHGGWGLSLCSPGATAELVRAF